MNSTALKVSTLLALLGFAGPIAAAPAELAPGDPAPEFELLGTDGRTYTLANLLDGEGKRGIVLAWFPQAFTPG